VKPSTLVALPSVFREGMVGLLLEAQAAGKSAVAYDVCGSRDAIEHEATGLLVPPGDVEAFCRAAERLLADVELRRAMGRTARRRIRDRFTVSASIEAQLAALSAVLRDKGITPPWP